MWKGMFYLASTVLLAACGQNAPQQQSDKPAEEAVRLFEQACIVNDGRAQSVAVWAERQQLRLLDGNAVKKLPLGMMELNAQSVWETERQGAVFYISTAPASCSVKTARADHQTAARLFTELAERGRGSAVGRFRAAHSTPSPFPFNQLVYSWHENGSPEEILLTANTSPSEHVPAQLALYFTRQAVSTANVVSPQ